MTSLTRQGLNLVGSSVKMARTRSRLLLVNQTDSLNQCLGVEDCIGVRSQAVGCVVREELVEERTGISGLQNF